MNRTGELTDWLRQIDGLQQPHKQSSQQLTVLWLFQPYRVRESQFSAAVVVLVSTWATCPSQRKGTRYASALPRRPVRPADWGVGMTLCIAAVADGGNSIVTVSDVQFEVAGVCLKTKSGKFGASCAREYRTVKEELGHREVQIRRWAEGFTTIAEALKSDRPDRMVFVGDASMLQPGDHAILLANYPPKERLKFGAEKLVALRLQIKELEQDLRRVGEWPVA